VYSELEAVLIATHKDNAALQEVAELVLAIPSRAGAMQADLEVGSRAGAGVGDDADYGTAKNDLHRQLPWKAVLHCRSPPPTSPFPPRARPQFLLGKDWREKLPPSKAAEAYAAHLRRVAARDPAMLIPFAWSLNVPILLPFMGKRIAQGLGLDEKGPGLAFFDVRWLFGGGGCGGRGWGWRGCGVVVGGALQFTSPTSPSSTRPNKSRSNNKPKPPHNDKQIPSKGGRLPQLRAAVNRAGPKLTQEQRTGCLHEAVEQFRRNNAVVKEFRLPLGSAAAALMRAVRAARRLLVAVAMAVFAVVVALNWRLAR